MLKSSNNNPASGIRRFFKKPTDYMVLAAGNEPPKTGKFQEKQPLDKDSLPTYGTFPRSMS